MATENYTVVYIADASAFVAGSRQVVNALAAVDLASARTKVSLQGFAGGAGRSATNSAKKINDLTTALNAVPSAANNARSSLNGLNASLGNANKNIGKFLTVSRSLSIARAAFHELMELSRDLEKHWQDMAKESAEFRDTLRELASIRGHQGPNNTVLADTLTLGLDMGMVPEKAREFAQAYENVGPMIRQMGHYQPSPGQGTKEDLEQGILGEVGRTAQRLGIDPKEAANLLGTTGLAHTIHSKEEGMDRFAGAVRGLQKGKLEYTPAVKALNKAAAKLVNAKEAEKEGALPGRLPSVDEAGIYMGALSFGTGTADQASHRMVQNSRLLNTSREKGQKALEAAGITPEMNDVQKLIQLEKYVRSQKIPDVNKWLQANDLGTEATREGMVASLKIAPQLEEDLKANRAKPAGKEFIADNDHFMANDRSARARRVETIEKTNNQIEGEMVEPLEQAKRLAEQRRRADKDSGYNGIIDMAGQGFASIFTYPTRGVSGFGHTNEIDEKHGAIPTLEREARRLGIDPTKQFPNLRSFDYQTRAKAFHDLDEMVRSKKGDPLALRATQDDARRRVAALRPAAPGAQAAAPANAPGGVGVAGNTARLEQQVGQLVAETKRTNQILQQNQRPNMERSAPVPPSPPPGAVAPRRP